jgi:hypothetical protein
MTFYYRGFDDDKGNGYLTLSDDGCVLAGAFQIDIDAARGGAFRLQRYS